MINPNLLEPDGPADDPMVSIAISLKRIADFFTTSGVAPGGGENTFWEALENVAQGMNR